MRYSLWGSELSPFALKVEAMLRYRALPYRWLPGEGGALENLRVIARLRGAARRRDIQRFDGLTPLDEYPQVPFLLLPDGEITYDSSAIAYYLDANVRGQDAPLMPEDPIAAFVVRLLDETFDEFGLYMAHHMRWVGSAGANDAGERLAAEFRSLLPLGLRKVLATRFARRQVRRLPYLFSVAPQGLQQSVEPSLQAPAPAGWPATHALLEKCWRQTLVMLENLLDQQPYLLGERFTLADASLYGELAINTDDAGASQLMQELAPASYAWVQRIRRGEHVAGQGDVSISEALLPLLKFAMETFVPLMQQNARAWSRLRAQGEQRFNETGFDASVGLYDGELLGQPFRSVVKTFQVRVWQDLCRHWQVLDSGDREALRKMLPGAVAFESG